MRVLNWVVAIGVVAAGCGTTEAPAGGSGTEPITLTVTHRSEWRVLWVEGDTDLPDGAVVTYRVTHELARSTPADEWPSTTLLESGRATVQDGRYWARVNTLNWPAGQVDVVVQFPLPPQPPEVVARYGEFGEHLAGDNVRTMSGIQAAEVEHTFEHRP